MVVGNHGNTIIRVVRSHDGVCTTVNDDALEWWKVGGPEFSLSTVNWTSVKALLGGCECREMLDRSTDISSL